MKKKFSAVILSVFLCSALFSCSAYAQCSHCENYPNSSWYLQSVDHQYECVTAATHCYSWWVVRRCKFCNAFLEYDPNDSYQFVEESHTFINEKCACGYKISATTKNTDLPSQSDLVDAARRLGQQAIGAIAIVRYAGNVRYGASTYAQIAGKVYIDETYDILDVEYADNGNVWLLINYGTQQVWVSSGLVEIQPRSTSGAIGGSMSHLIGRGVVVKVGSGNARSAPGTGSGKVGIVVRGEYYTILDCGYDQLGYLWYKIRIGYVDGWVSSGIVDLQ